MAFYRTKISSAAYLQKRLCAHDYGFLAVPLFTDYAASQFKHLCDDYENCCYSTLQK